jgi:hypothetical protein
MLEKARLKGLYESGLFVTGFENKAVGFLNIFAAG